jgi:hypothetical protein
MESVGQGVNPRIALKDIAFPLAMGVDAAILNEDAASYLDSAERGERM